MSGAVMVAALGAVILGVGGVTAIAHRASRADGTGFWRALGRSIGLNVRMVFDLLW